MKIKTKMACLAVFFMMSHAGFAQNHVTINNNTGQPMPPDTAPPPPQQQQPQCANANQNNIYDPRVPPAGVYTTRNGDGASSTTYTTGEKKPYIVDNNRNGSSSPQAMPQVYVQPPAAPVGR